MMDRRLLSLLFLNVLLSSTCDAWDINRRSILNQAATFASGALILGANNRDAAYADPYNALIPVGSGGLMQRPFEETFPEWKSPTLRTKLGSSRMDSRSLSPLQQGPFASQNELYYPSFLFGSWKIEATLKRKLYPFGKDFVPSKSLIEGSPRNRNEQVGSTTSFEIHNFLLQNDDNKNPNYNQNVDLSNPQSKIITDRRYNTISMSRAYQQLTPVEEVGWDYRSDPTRLTLRFGAAPLSDDMRPLGQRRGEVYFTARQMESSKDGSAFCTAERSRSITVGPGTVIAADQETITEYQKGDNDDTVAAFSRIAVYLTPNPNSREGVLWQQVGGNAVAFFDYDWKMTRITNEATSIDNQSNGVSRVCVTTPKEVLQCA